MKLIGAMISLFILQGFLSSSVFADDENYTYSYDNGTVFYSFFGQAQISPVRGYYLDEYTTISSITLAGSSHFTRPNPLPNDDCAIAGAMAGTCEVYVQYQVPFDPNGGPTTFETAAIAVKTVELDDDGSKITTTTIDTLHGEAIAGSGPVSTPTPIPPQQSPTPTPTPDSTPTPVASPTPQDSKDSCKVPTSSSINMDSRALSETIPMVGVPFTLQYSSDRFTPSSNVNMRSLGLGGWSPSILHRYDVANHILYFGDGNFKNAQAIQYKDGTVYLPNSSVTEVYFFDTLGNHLTTKDALTGVTKVSFTYDSTGRIYNITDTFGNVTQIRYGDSLVGIKGPYGQMTSVHLDSNGFISSVTNPNSETYNVVHSATGQMTSFQKPGRNPSTVTYDSSGRVIKDLGAGGDFISLLASINAQGVQTVISTTAVGRQTVYQTSANASGSIHQVTRPTGETTKSSSLLTSTSSTSSSGTVSSSTLADDPRFGSLAPYKDSSVFQISAAGIKLQTQTSIQASLANSNDPFSIQKITKSVTLQNDQLRKSTSIFDANSRTMFRTSSEGRTQRALLDSNGQITELQISSLNPARLTLDSMGRTTNIAQGFNSQRFVYDSSGNVKQSIDSLGRANSFSYDKAGRVVKQTSPSGASSSFTYDAAGNVTSITPPGRQAHTFTTNALELVASYLPPSVNSKITGATIYSYNLDKQLTAVAKPDGSQMQYRYDTASGLLSSISTVSGNQNYIYQSQSSLLTSETSIDGIMTSYSYAGPVPVAITNSGAVTSKFSSSYNADGSINKIDVQGASGASISHAYTYDKDGLVTQVNSLSVSRNGYGAIKSDSIGIVKETLAYDLNGATASRQMTDGKWPLFTAKYTRDTVGRLTDVNLGAFGFAELFANHFDYDSDGRLVKVSNGRNVRREYAYDSNGNRIQKKENGRILTAKYDEQDRLIQYGNNEYTYDANGQRISKIEHDFDCNHRDFKSNRDHTRTTTYSYDAFGNLKAVGLPNGTKISYVLDARGRRIGKMVSGKIVQGFVYSNQTQVIAMLDGKGQISQSFDYASKSNSPDVATIGTKIYRVVSDQVGTPRLIVDSKTGQIVEASFSDEFGNDPVNFGKSKIPFGFAGGISDSDTHLVHFGAREYDPEIGRWISKDPIGFAGGESNLYSYVSQDPINLIDPNGKSITFGILVCSSLTAGTTVVNAATAALEYIRINMEYNRTLEAIENSGKDECQIQIDITALNNRYEAQLNELHQSTVSPNGPLTAIEILGCLAAVLAPTP